MYTTIFRSCESRRECSLPSVRTELPSAICNHPFVQEQTLYMDYICIDSSVVSTTCVERFVPQTPRYGLLQNPGYPFNPDGILAGCHWVIYPDNDTEKEIEIIIHQAYSVEGRHLCDSQYLQIQYTLCDSRKQTIDRFCDEARVNIKLHSCGTVYIIHYPYLGGNDRGNRFLVSYSVKYGNSYEKYMFPCERVTSRIDRARYRIEDAKESLTDEHDKPTTEKRIFPDLPRNVSSVADTDDVHDDRHNSIRSGDPWQMVTLLRECLIDCFYHFGHSLSTQCYPIFTNVLHIFFIVHMFN